MRREGRREGEREGGRDEERERMKSINHEAESQGSRKSSKLCEDGRLLMTDQHKERIRNQ